MSFRKVEQDVSRYVYGEISGPQRTAARNELDDHGDAKESSRLTKPQPEIYGLIEELVERIRGKKSTSFVMVMIIFLIVSVGSYFSIGSVALNEYKRIEQVEYAKDKLMQNVSDISATTTYVCNCFMKDSVAHDTAENRIIDLRDIRLLSSEVARLDSSIANGLYGGLSTQHLEEKISEVTKNKLQWDEIVMRISLATLTVFLVQIFFNVYKYFQAQINFLENKLELLRLYENSDSEEDKRVLKKALLAKMGNPPGFGKDPATPIDQILKIADKVKPG